MKIWNILNDIQIWNIEKQNIWKYEIYGIIKTLWNIEKLEYMKI